jgi:hypothetical protein
MDWTRKVNPFTAVVVLYIAFIKLNIRDTMAGCKNYLLAV